MFVGIRYITFIQDLKFSGQKKKMILNKIYKHIIFGHMQLRKGWKCAPKRRVGTELTNSIRKLFPCPIKTYAYLEWPNSCCVISTHNLKNIFHFHSQISFFFFCHTLLLVFVWLSHVPKTILFFFIGDCSLKL